MRWPALARLGVVLAILLVALVGGTSIVSAQTGGEPGGGPLPDPQQSPAEVRDAADDVLSRPEFQHEPGLVERATTWIFDRLNGLFSALGGGAGGQSLLGWVALALLAGVVGFFVYRLLRTVQPPTGDDDESEVSVTRSGRRIDWLERAADAEADGRWRLGLRCRYRALAASLTTLGVLDDIPGRTTGEHRQEVTRRAPEASVPFAGAAELFDRAWYGNLPTGPDESSRFQGLAEQVLARARRPDRRAVDELDSLVAPR